MLGVDHYKLAIDPTIVFILRYCEAVPIVGGNTIV